MGYLLSKPNNWTVRIGDLYKQGPAGVNKVKRILKELRDADYLERTRIRQPDGTFEWETTVYETPAMALKTTDGKQCHILGTDTNNKNEKRDKTAESSSEHYNNSSELFTSNSTNSFDEPKDIP